MKKIKMLYKIAAMLIFPSCFILNTKAMDGIDGNKTGIEKNTASAKEPEKIDKKIDEMVKKGTEKFKEKYEKTKENIEKINKKYIDIFKFKETDDFIKKTYDEFYKQYEDFNKIFTKIKNSIEQSNDNEQNVKNYIDSLFDYLKTEKKENKIEKNEISEYVKTKQLFSKDIHHRANALANYRFLNVLLYFIYKFYANNESTFGDITTEDIDDLNSNFYKNNAKLNFLKNIVKNSYLNLDNIYNDAFDSAIEESGKDKDLFDKKEIIAKIKEETSNSIPKEEIDDIKTLKLNLTKFLYYKINKLIVVYLTNAMSKAIENFKNKYNDDETNYTLNKIETEDVFKARKNGLFNDLFEYNVEDDILKQVEEYYNDLANLLNISNIDIKNVKSFISDMKNMNIDILKNIYDKTLSKIADIGEENLDNYTENLVNAIIDKYNNFQKNNNPFNNALQKIKTMLKNDENLRESTKELKNLDDKIKKDEYYEEISDIIRRNDVGTSNYVQLYDSYLYREKSINKEKIFKLLIKDKFSNYDVINKLLKNKYIIEKFFNDKPLDISKICNLTNSKTDILTECLWLKFFIYSLYKCYSYNIFIADNTPSCKPIEYYETNKLGEKALSSDLNFPYMFLNNNYLNIEYGYEKFFENIMNEMNPKDREKYEHISKEDIINKCYEKNKNNHFDKYNDMCYITYLYREISCMFLIYINDILEQIIEKVNKFDENEIPENFLHNIFFKRIDIDKETNTNEIIDKISNNEPFKKQYHDIAEGVCFLKDDNYELILNFIKLISKEIYTHILSNYDNFKKEIIIPIVNENQKILKKELSEKEEKDILNAHNNDEFKKDLSFFKIKNKFYNDENLNSFLEEKVENFENHSYHETADNLLKLKDIYDKISKCEQNKTDRYRLLDNKNLIKFVLENVEEFNKDDKENLDFRKSSCISNTVNNVLLECGLLKMYLYMLYSCYNKGLTFAGTKDLTFAGTKGVTFTKNKDLTFAENSNFRFKDSRYWFDEEKLFNNKENGYKTLYYPMSWQFPCQLRLHSNLKAVNMFKRYLYIKLKNMNDIITYVMKNNMKNVMNNDIKNVMNNDIQNIMKNEIFDKTFKINFESRMKKNQNLDKIYNEAIEIANKEIENEIKNETPLTNKIKKEREEVSSKFADFLNGRQETFDEFKDSTLENNKVARNIGNIREEYLIYIYTKISKMFFVKIDHLLKTIVKYFNKKILNKDSMVNKNFLLENFFQKIIGDDLCKEIFDLLKEHRKTLYEKINFTNQDKNGALFLIFIKTISRDIYKVLFEFYQYCKKYVENLYKIDYSLNNNLYSFIEQKIKYNDNNININSPFLYLSNEDINAFRDIEPTIFLESIRKNENEKKATNIEDDEEYIKYDNEIFIKPQKNSNIIYFNGKKFKLINDIYFEENENNETIKNISQKIKDFRENKNKEQSKKLNNFLKYTKNRKVKLSDELKKFLKLDENIEPPEEIKEFLKIDEEIKKHLEDLKNLKDSRRLINYFNVYLYHHLNRDIINKINYMDIPLQHEILMHIMLRLYKYFNKETDYFLKQQFTKEKQKNDYEKLKNLNILGIKDLYLIPIPEDIKEYFEKLNFKDFILNNIKYAIKYCEKIHDKYAKLLKDKLGEDELDKIIISELEYNSINGDWLDTQIKLDSVLSNPNMYFFMDIPLQILRLISQNPAYSKDEDLKNMLVYDQEKMKNNIKKQFEKQLKEEQLKLNEEQHKLDEEQLKLNEEKLKLDEKQSNEKQFKLNEKQLELTKEQFKLKDEQFKEKRLKEKIEEAEKKVEINKLTILRDFLVGMWQIYEEAVPNMKNFNFLYKYYLYGPKNYFKDMFQNYYDYAADGIKSAPNIHSYKRFIQGFFPYNILNSNFLYNYLFKKIFKNTKKEEFNDFITTFEEIEKNIAKAEEINIEYQNIINNKYQQRVIASEGKKAKEGIRYIPKTENDTKFTDIDRKTNMLKKSIEKIFLTNLELSYDGRFSKKNKNKELSEYLLSKQLDFANKIYLYKYIEENKIIIMTMIDQINEHINALKDYKGSLSDYKEDKQKYFKQHEQIFLKYDTRFSNHIINQYNNEYFKKPNAQKLNFLWDVVLYSRTLSEPMSLSKNIVDNLDKESYSNIESYINLCNMLSLYDKDDKIIKDYMERYNEVKDFKYKPKIAFPFEKNDSIEKKLNTAEKFCIYNTSSRMDRTLSLKHILYILYKIFPLKKIDPRFEIFKQNGIFSDLLIEYEKETENDHPEDYENFYNLKGSSNKEKKDLSNKEKKSKEFIDENSTKYDSEDSEDDKIKYIKAYITNKYGAPINKLENGLRKFQIYTKINRNKTKIENNFKGCKFFRNLHLDLNNEENINIVRDSNGKLYSEVYNLYNNDEKDLDYQNPAYTHDRDEKKKINNLFSKANSYSKNKKDLTNCSNQINNLYLVTKKEALNRNLPLNDKIFNILLEYVNVLKTLGTNIDKLTKNLKKSYVENNLKKFNIQKIIKKKLMDGIFEKTILDFEKTFNSISKVMYGREYDLYKYFHDKHYKKIPFKEYEKYINYEDFEEYLDNLNIISNEKDKKIKILYNLITEEIENLKTKFILYIFSQIDKKEAYEQIIEELSFILNIKDNKTMTYDEYKKNYDIISENEDSEIIKNINAINEDEKEDDKYITLFTDDSDDEDLDINNKKKDEYKKQKEILKNLFNLNKDKK